MGQASLYPTVLVNVDRVLSHCRAEHQAGKFGKEGRFVDYVPAMKIAIDAYLEHPRDSLDQLLFTAQARYDLQCGWSIPQWHEGARDATVVALRFLGVAAPSRWSGASIGNEASA